MARQYTNDRSSSGQPGRFGAAGPGLHAREGAELGGRRRVANVRVEEQRGLLFRIKRSLRETLEVLGPPVERLDIVPSDDDLNVIRTGEPWRTLPSQDAERVRLLILITLSTSTPARLDAARRASDRDRKSVV